jgi:DNA-binding MarR family transcriptional regulator
MNARMPRDLATAPAQRDGEVDPLRVWLRLLAVTNVVEGSLRSAFRSEFDSTLPRFDLMAQLDRHPEGLRMGEISKLLMVTSGNVTGITDQLVAEGLVTREAPPADRRAFVIRLTPAGRTAFRRMAEAHERWIRELFAGLDAAERKALHLLLAKLRDGARRQEDH